MKQFLNKLMFLFLFIINISGQTVSAQSLSNTTNGANIRKGYYATIPLYGEIKNITYRYYLLNDDGITQIKHKYIFDSCGNVSRHIEYNSDGSIYYEIEYKYSNTGSLLEVSDYFEEKLSSTTKYTYNSNENLATEISIAPNGSQLFKKVYRYDSNGNNIEQILYKSDNTIDTRSIYKYDSAGNCILEEKYDSYSLNPSKFYFKYDYANNLIEMISTPNIDSASGYKNTYKYNKNGQLIEMSQYRSNGDISFTQVYAYDSMGNRIKNIITVGAGLVFMPILEEYEIVYGK